MQRLLTIAVFRVACAPLVLAGDFEAGAAQSVITPALFPERPVYLAGFGHNRIATGVHDDLYARCLALGFAKQKLVVCSVDLIGLFYDDVLTIRREFEQAAPSAFLVVAATHTRMPGRIRWVSTAPSRCNRGFVVPIIDSYCLYMVFLTIDEWRIL